ncbi:MAG TPA: EamA family transporter [Candidatus Angelobacter sp.]|nr:EamA family transporter [Candidatus Angelobacter sp.]
MQAESAESSISSNPATSQSHPWRGYILIAAAAFCWGASATFGKALFSGRLFGDHARISPLVLSQARTTFAVLLLSGFLLARFGPTFFRIARRDLALCLLVGTLGLAGSNYFYYLAIQKSTVAVAITLQYTAPLWVLITMVLRGRERFTFLRISSVLLAMIGIALTIGLFRSGITINRWGAAAAMVASFSFAFYNILAQTLVSRNHQLVVMAYALLGSASLWLIVDPPWKLAAQHFSLKQWGFLFVFSCCATLVPYFFYFSGLKYLDPTRAIVASCLEPVFAILFAAAFVGESISFPQGAGITAVLVATVMVQIWRQGAATENIPAG